MLNAYDLKLLGEVEEVLRQDRKDLSQKVHNLKVKLSKTETLEPPMTPAVDLDVQVQRMYRFETDRPLKAFVDVVVNNALLIKGLRVMQGKEGLFVSMPSEMAKDKKWYDTVRCLTQELRDVITEKILSAYKEK